MQHTLPCTRRRFLTAAATTAAVLPWLPSPGLANSFSIVKDVRRRADPDLHELAARAIEAARAAGAEYADVRLTRSRRQTFVMSSPARESEEFGAGVRALVNGYWGFYSSAIWTSDEMARLARGAVDQARANGVGRSRTVDLAPIPVVDREEWRMPVKYDPFDIPIAEKLDVMRSANDFASSYALGVSGGFNMNFDRMDKVFASTEGSSWQQTLYQSSCGFSVGYRDQYSLGVGLGGTGADFMSVAGKGWEHVSESGLLEEIPRLVDEAEQSRHKVPVDIGRYEAVFTPVALANLLNATIGPATQLSRAMGFEANAEGTSFLSNPLDMLGEYVVGSPKLTVTANRSQVGGAATVRWDEESTEPEEFTVIKNGTLNDFQTTREQASWLAPWYGKHGLPVRSHGCANAESARRLTTQRLPNLAVTPDPNGETFESMVAGIKKGIAVVNLQGLTMDQQVSSGIGYGSFREIVNGKLGRYITGAGITFRTVNLWKGLLGVGAPSAQQWFGFTKYGGQPTQRTVNSVGTAPARFQEVDVVDIMRKI